MRLFGEVGWYIFWGYISNLFCLLPLVKLPALLVHTDLGLNATAALTACLQDFAKHLAKNINKYNTVYEETTGQYKKFVPS